MTAKKYNAGVIGTGFFVPERVMTNFDIQKLVDTSDEWITTRTGIHERRISEPGTSVSDLAYKAAVMAIDDAGTKAEEIDLIIFATLTADCICPSAASILSAKLGATRAAAFDLSAACSGFVYASSVAAQFIENGVYGKILVIGAETLSKYINWQDRNTCVLFGDGAGAAVYGRVPEGYGVMSFDLGCDGTGADYLGVGSPAGEYMTPDETFEKKKNRIHMNGKEVFKFAVKAMGATLTRSLERAGIDESGIDWLVPHQANIRIIHSAAKRLALPPEKVIINIDRFGNVSAGSIPMALAEAAGKKTFKKGDVIALAGFGAGLTWASCIMRWAKED